MAAGYPVTTTSQLSGLYKKVQGPKKGALHKAKQKLRAKAYGR